MVESIGKKHSRSLTSWVKSHKELEDWLEFVPNEREPRKSTFRCKVCRAGEALAYWPLDISTNEVSETWTGGGEWGKVGYRQNNPGYVTKASEGAIS